MTSAARALLAQQAVASALAALPPSDRAASVLLAALGRSLGCAFGAAWQAGDDRRLSCVASWCAPRRVVASLDRATRRLRLDAGEELPGRVWQSRTPAWMRLRAGEGTSARGTAIARIGLTAGLAFPVRSGDRCVGVIELYSQDAVPPEAGLLDALRTIGAQIGQYIDRRRAEEADPPNRAREGEILDAAPEAVIAVDGRSRIAEINRAAQRLCGVRREAALGRTLPEIIAFRRWTAGGGRRPFALHEADWDGRLGAPLPALAVRADGREVEVELSTARTRLGEDTLLIACVREARPAASATRQSLVAKEQSARREAQAARERARQLVSHALGAEDRERRRIAQVLHDEALQNLLVARQDLREVALGNKGALAFVEDALTRTIAQLRENLLDLSPASSGEDVASALRTVAEPLSRRAGFQWSISVDPDALGCHDQLVVSLAREWLNNAAKHSGGSKVQLTLARTGSAVVLEVIDDGRGIAAGDRERALRGGHFGLASSSTRLAALGGKLEILSAEGAGTRIRGVLPLPGPGCSEAVGADGGDARPHV